jgi:hypothetical protein
LGLEHKPGDRVRRLRQISETLSRLRSTDPERVESLHSAIERFSHSLEALGIGAAELDTATRLRTAFAWAIRRIVLFGIGGPIAAAGTVMMFVPYRLTGLIARRPGLDSDERATWKIMAGTVFYLSWTILIAIAAGLFLGWPWAVAVFVLVPPVALVTYRSRDLWVDACVDVRRYVALRRRSDLRSWLLELRRELAESLEHLRQESESE